MTYDLAKVRLQARQCAEMVVNRTLPPGGPSNWLCAQYGGTVPGEAMDIFDSEFMYQITLLKQKGQVNA